MPVHSQKQERDALIRHLRGQGHTWVEIAEVFRQRYHVNPRLALRWAHGWSQSDAAEQWNKRWPDDLKTNKNISSWELWPASTGHLPSLGVLNRLAELYQCSLTDLLVDQSNYRHQDSAHNALPVATETPPVLSGDIVAASQAEILFLDLLNRHPLTDRTMPRTMPPTSAASATALLPRLQEATLEEMAQVIEMWAHSLNPNVDRRDLLTKLSVAFTLAATAPLFDGLDPDERAYAASSLRQAERFDESTLRYLESTVANLRRQSDVLGPRLILQTAMGHREMAARLASVAPEAYRPRALSAYAELSQLVGFLCFNAGDYRGAQHYYDDARGIAHDAHDIELVTYVLCTMSHLATWQGKPRVGIDHAVAAQMWARQTGSPKAEAYAADVAARAFAADREAGNCHQAIDAEGAALARWAPDANERSWWYYYDQSFCWGTKSNCALHLGDPDAALTAAAESITLIDPTNVHDLAFTTLFRAEAHIQKSNVAEAAKAIGEAAILASVNTSRRIDQRITSLRTALTPHQRSKPVRELDETLATYRRSVSSSGRM